MAAAAAATAEHGHFKALNATFLLGTRRGKMREKIIFDNNEKRERNRAADPCILCTVHVLLPVSQLLKNAFIFQLNFLQKKNRNRRAVSTGGSV